MNEASVLMPRLLKVGMCYGQRLLVQQSKLANVSKIKLILQGVKSNHPYLQSLYVTVAEKTPCKQIIYDLLKNLDEVHVFTFSLARLLYLRLLLNKWR